MKYKPVSISMTDSELNAIRGRAAACGLSLSSCVQKDLDAYWTMLRYGESEARKILSIDDIHEILHANACNFSIELWLKTLLIEPQTKILLNLAHPFARVWLYDLWCIRYDTLSLSAPIRLADDIPDRLDER